MASPLNNTSISDGMGLDGAEKPKISDNPLILENTDESAINPLRWTVVLLLLVAISILLVFIAGYRPVSNIWRNLSTGEPFLKQKVVKMPKPTELETKTVVYGEAEKKELVNLVNEYRKKNNLSVLTVNKELQASAQAHAEDMFKRYYFSHTDPEGKTPYDRLNNTDYAKVGENIIQGNMINVLNPANALKEWIKSPPHKETLLTKDWKLTGIGVKQGTRINPETQEEEPIVIWVQLFGVKR